MDALGKFREHARSQSCSRLLLEQLLRIFRALQPNFPRASITRNTQAKHEQLCKLNISFRISYTHQYNTSIIEPDIIVIRKVMKLHIYTGWVFAKS